MFGVLSRGRSKHTDRLVELAESHVDRAEVRGFVGRERAGLREFLQPFGRGEVVVAERRNRQIPRPLEPRGAQSAVVDEESAQPAREFRVLLAGVVQAGVGRRGQEKQQENVWESISCLSRFLPGLGLKHQQPSASAFRNHSCRRWFAEAEDSALARPHDVAGTKRLPGFAQVREHVAEEVKDRRSLVVRDADG